MNTQMFTTSFQPVNRTSTGSTPPWEFRCVGGVHSGGRGCGDFESPAIELRYQGSQIFKLSDRPLTGPWIRTPSGSSFKSVSGVYGGALLCEALGYDAPSSQSQSNTFAPQGNWAVVQVNPYVFGTAADGGGFSYQEPVLSLDCSCAPP